MKEVLEKLRDYREEQFSKKAQRGAATAFPPGAHQFAASLYGRAEPLSRQERADALATWRADKDEHIMKGREHVLGVGLTGMGIRITSCSAL